MTRSNPVRSALAWACFGAVAAVAGTARAAHPLQTEDTGTQGAGNIEFENGLSRLRGDGSAVDLYQPQLSYGVATPFDLIVQPSWLRQHDDDGGTARRGIGDTNVDFKWRFYGATPLSFAVRAGLTLATARRGLGIAHGSAGVHALAVATWDVAPLTLHGNLGISRQPADAGERSTIRHVSGALMWAVDERLTLTVDMGADSNADAGRRAWPATALAGAIYTIRPGLDADIGYQSHLNSASGQRQWLLGLTYRFAP